MRGVFLSFISMGFFFLVFSSKEYPLTTRRMKILSAIKSRIVFKLAAELPQLRDVLSQGNIEEAQKIIDRVNSYNGDPQALELPEVLNVEDFINSCDYSYYHEKALSLILDGKYGVEFFFAGAATRLRNSLERVLGKERAQKLAGPMYFVDIWAIAEALGYKLPEYALKGVGMGPRQFLQLNTVLTQLALQAGVEPREVLSKQKIILHINSGIEERVRRDLVEHNFYGFNPQNIIFVVQPVLPGFKIEKDQVIPVVESPKYPYGHGYAFQQLLTSGVSYYIDRENRATYLDRNALEFLENSGVEILAMGRINDLTKFTSQILDIDKISFALRLIEQGYNIVTEIVYNPQQQKGGFFFKDMQSGKQFFLEGLSLNTPELEQRVEELREKVSKEASPSLPNSVSRTYFEIHGLQNILSENLPLNLRIRGRGCLYPELLWGDVTRSRYAKTAGIMKGEEFIQDFKELKDLSLAVNYLSVQDANSRFREITFTFIKNPQ